LAGARCGEPSPGRSRSYGVSFAIRQSPGFLRENLPWLSLRRRHAANFLNCGNVRVDHGFDHGGVRFPMSARGSDGDASAIATRTRGPQTCSASTSGSDPTARATQWS